MPRIRCLKHPKEQTYLPASRCIHRITRNSAAGGETTAVTSLGRAGPENDGRRHAAPGS
ncbi:hypothetical protein ALC57_02580 [Trachymyrmex cornetzi]|uniref:Uncharacterized protein n=1 Tax=Trachymyrmex cornetzi TaxID=471704 RepID=A0A151JNJ7_9HYME|nr:hypothetical protein ALC57_02580 [Trachymyrmex cornetzi]